MGNMRRLACWTAVVGHLLGCGGNDPAKSGSPSGGSGGQGGANGGAVTTSGNAGTLPTGGNGGSGGASGGSPSNAGSTSGGTSGAGGGATVSGAISLNFTTMGSCQEQAQFFDLPSAASGHPVSEASKAGMVENGGMSEDGLPVRVLCRWLSKQSPHSFSAVVEVGTGNKSLFANIGATGLVEGADGMGSVILEAPMLSEPYSSPNLGCAYSVIEIDPASRSIWGRFTCSSVEAEASGDKCSIDASFFAFENCEASPG